MEKIKSIFLRIREFVRNNRKVCIAAGAIVAVAVIVIVVVRVSGNRPARTATEEYTLTDNNMTEEDKTVTDDGTDRENTTEGSVTEEYINPLTGEKTDKDYSGQRPYAVMLNTIRQALPQSGNSYADMYIEMTEEGGITRVLGIYNDISDAGKIGSIRSTREYYLSWAMGLDAILVHAGGDSWVLKEIKNTGYTSLNCVGDAGYYAMSAFYRDPDRVASAGSEHALYTTGNGLKQFITDNSIDTRHTRDDYTRFIFAEDGNGTPDGGTANNVKVTFSGYKSTDFVYNSDKGQYDVFFWDEPYLDDSNNQNITVANIIILPVPNWTEADAWSTSRQKYDMSGGTGYYISGGKYIEINWTKGDYNKRAEYANSFNMTDKEGNPVRLSTGKTYICMMSDMFAPQIG